jgi:hypothetical protein
MLGFRLLVHAEIEHYIEQRVGDIAKMARDRYSLDGKARTIILALLAYYDGKWPETVESISVAIEPKAMATIHKRIGRAHDVFRHMVFKENNGIKERNILRLLLPVGILIDDLDSTWLNTLNSFGASRGNTAHLSAKTQQPIDPKTEIQTVEQILQGLERVDARLSDLELE